MSFLLMDDNFYDHPKLVGLAPADGWGWVKTLAWCKRHQTDGHVPAQVVEFFGANPANLVKAGLLEPANDGGFDVHDYLQWNRSGAEVLATREAKRIGNSIGGQRSVEVRRERYGTAHPVRWPSEVTTPNSISTSEVHRKSSGPSTDTDTYNQEDLSPRKRGRDDGVSGSAPRFVGRDRPVKPTSPGTNANGPACGRDGCKGHQVNRTNPTDGHAFVGCTLYPDCRWVRTGRLGDRPEPLDGPPDPDSLTDTPWKNSGGDEIARRIKAFAATKALEPIDPGEQPL